MGNELSRNRDYFFELIKSVILKKKAPEPYENIDWHKIYRLSARHSIANIIAYAIDTLDSKIDDEAFKLFENYRNIIIAQEAQQEAEAVNLTDKFERAHIKNMPIKGCVMKKLYPSPNMRSMCDIDILIEDDGIDRAEKIMQNLDYPIREVSDREIVYKRPPFISVELHRSFVSEKYQKVIFDYYKNIWNMAVLTDGKKYTYELSKEDFYVYMIVHIAKHYMSGGVGIISIIDVYVFMHRYRDMLNFEYINTEFNKLGLYEFAKNILMLTDEWFENKEKSEIGLKMAQYIFYGVTYGSKVFNDAAYALKNNEKNAHISSLKKIIYAVFLPYENMCILYPKLKQRRVLLPIYWIIRGFNRLLHNKNDVKANLTNKATNESIVQLKKHFDDVGLK